MLARIGVASVEDLFQNVPPELRLDRPLDVPPALTELELTQHLQALAARNRPAGFLDPDDLRRAVDDETLCVVAQHPNFFGCLEEPEALAQVAHDKGALFVASFDPVSLGLLKGPGQYAADIAVAEGQGLGVPM